MQSPYVIVHQAFRLLGLLQSGILYIDDGGARTQHNCDKLEPFSTKCEEQVFEMIW